MAGLARRFAGLLARIRTPAPVSEPRDELRDYLDLAGIMLLALDRDGRIEAISRHGAAMLGHGDPAALVGRDWFETALPPEDRLRIRGVFQSIMAGAADAPLKHENHILAPDGGRRLIAWTNRLRRDASGRVAGTLSSGEDITDARAALDALRASEARFRSLAENIREVFYVHDLGAERIAYISPAYEEVWGRPAEDLYNNLFSFIEAVHPDDRPKLFAAIGRQRAGESSETNYRVVRTDGTIRHIHDRAFVAADPVTGQPIVVGIAEDVSARVADQARLRETEERYRLAARATNDAIWDWDLGTDQIIWNGALATLFGHAPDVSGSGDFWKNHIHPQDRERVVVGIQAAIDGTDDLWTEEYRFRRADGSYADVVDHGFAVRDSDGRALRMVGAMMDLSERKAREERVRASEERFRQLAEAMPALVLVSDAQGVVDYVNRRFQDQTGIDATAAAGGGWLDAVHPDDRDHVSSIRRAAHERRVSYEVECRLRVSSGGYRTYLARANPVLDGEGTPVQWVAACTDIEELTAARRTLTETSAMLERQVREAVAEREAALADLRQVQKIETLGQLTGGVAHDMNNLLTPIVATLDMVKRRLPDDPRLTRMVDGALQSADRSKIMVQRLLAFARRQALAPQPVDLAELIGGMADLIGRSVGPAIRVRTGIDTDLPAALADANQLELALLNLALNARDAMPGGGTLTVEAAFEKVRLPHRAGLGPGDYVRLTVADTGSGMDADTLKRAVEPFFSTKGVGKGTGLGLSMVHGLAAQSGGALDIASTPGEGTTVRLWLPVAYATTQPVAPASVQPAIRALSVLLVDDEELVRDSIAVMLEDLGHAVTRATTGAEALDRLRGGQHCDLLVTDYLMPGLNGVELAAAARSLRPGMPVLLVTGYQNTAAAAPDLGLPCLDKPFTRTELAETVAALTRDADKVVPLRRPAG